MILSRNQNQKHSKKFRILMLAAVFVVASAVFGAVKFWPSYFQKEKTVEAPAPLNIEELPKVEVEAKEIFKDAKHDWSPSENPEFIITIPGIKTEKPQGVFDKIFGAKGANAAQEKIVKAEILTSGGQKPRDDINISLKDEEDGSVKISVEKPKRAFEIVKYQLNVEVLSADNQQILTTMQDFTWGVLAINVNKSIYAPGEEAKIAIGVLNENGGMVCDANVKLEVKNPNSETEILSTENGRIKVNEICQSHDYSLEPDYQASYQTGGAGTYTMTLTAEDYNGTYTITDKFEVQENAAFDVERVSATRTYPKNIYPVTFNIKANQDFKGQVIETVPSSFEILDPKSEIPNKFQIQNSNNQNEKNIIWEVDVKKGETFNLEYRYDPPDISPEFYLLGPAEFSKNREIVFQESRQWQIANDAVYTCVPTGSSPTDWTTAGGWTGCNSVYPGQNVTDGTNQYDVTINNASAWTVNVANNPTNSIRNLSVGSTGNAVNHTLNFSGNYTLTMQGTTTIYAGSSAAASTNQITVVTGVLDSGGLITIQGSSTSYARVGQLTATTGTVYARAGVTITSNANAKLTYTDAGHLYLTGTFAATTNGAISLNAGSTTHASGSATINKAITHGKVTLEAGSTLALGANQTVAGTGTTTDWNNQSSSTVLSGNYAVSFTGAAPGIGGAYLTNFYNLTIGAVAAVTLNQNISVGNNLVFTALTGAARTQLNQNGYNLTVTGAVTFNQPGATYLSTWAVGAGTATIGGSLTMGTGGNTTSGRANKITVASGGTLELNNTAAASLIFTSNTTVANQAIDLSGGTGTVKIAGTITRSANATSIPGNSGSTWNFDGTVAQTIPVKTANTIWGACTTQCYSNLTIMNTNTSGATLGTNIASGDVAGNITVGDGSASAIFNNGGYSITNNSTGTFSVTNGATFNMTGTSTYPSGFSTYTYGASSTVNYKQTNGPTITNASYGNLGLMPAGATDIIFPGTMSTISGTLTCGDGSNAGGCTAVANDPTLDIDGNVSIAASSEFVASDLNGMTVAGNWTNAGTFTSTGSTVTFNGTSAQTITAGGSNFNNVTFANSSGANPDINYTGALTIGGTTTLNTATYVASTNDTGITFTGAVNGANILSVNSGSGAVIFSSTIGNSTPVTSVTSSGSGAVTITGNITTRDVASNNVSFTGAVTLGGGLTITTDNTTNDGTITFSSTVNGTQNLTVNAGSAQASFNGNVGATNALGTLTKQGSGDLTFGSSTLTATGLTLSAGTINNAATNSGVWTVSGNVTISIGTTLKSTTTTFNVGGDWTNDRGTFTANSATVVLNGTGAQTLSGAMTTTSAFNNLTITNTNGLSTYITFSDDMTTTGQFEDNANDSHVKFAITKTFTFATIDISATTGHNIVMTSTNASPGTPAGPQWYLNVAQASPTVSYVEVYDSDADAGNDIIATDNCTNGGNNEYWTFASGPATVVEFVSVVDPGGSSSSDYSSLSIWESTTQADLTSVAVKVFGGTKTGTIANSASVTGSNSGATGTVIHANAAGTQILLTVVSGTFQSAEQIRVDGSNYFTTTDAGNEASVVATCRTTSGAADTTSVEISGWTTDEDHYIKIWTDPDEPYRHQGKWNETKYRMEISNAAAINIDEAYVRIDGIQTKTLSTNGNDDGGINFYHTSQGEIQISNSIFRGISSSSNYHCGLQTWGLNASTVVKVWNNTFYDFKGSGSPNGGILMYNSGSSFNFYLYNNTFINCNYGIYRDIGAVIVKNNIFQDNTNTFYGTIDSASTNNITDQSAEEGAFGTTAETGTTTSAASNKLIQTGKTFASTVRIGMIVKDSGTNYSYVTAVDSDTQLSLNDDIMGSGETYTIYTNMYGSPTFEDEDNDDFHLDSSDTVAKNKGADLYDAADDSNLNFTTDIDGNARIDGDDIWDIGADENIAKIYRSVGPGATSAITSGTANNHTNHLTISGIWATLELPLPDNIGVGDAIQYDSDNNGSIDAIAFVDKRFSAQKYRIKAASGAAPTAMAVADIDWSIFRSYTSLATAESIDANADENNGIADAVENFDNWTAGQDLVTAQKQWNIAAYANGTTADTATTIIDGWTTSTDSYIKVYTPTSINEVGTSQRHSGVWDTSKYYMSISNANALVISDEYVYVDGLQATVVSPTTDRIIVNVSSVSASNDIRISGNIFKGHGNASYIEVGINFLDLDTIGKIWNNIIYDIPVSSNVANRVMSLNGNTAYVYNNTLYGGYDGIHITHGNVIAKNNNVQGTYNTANGYGAFGGDFDSSSTNNLSCAADAPGSNPQNSKTVTFVDLTNKDFHLAPNDSVAKNVGTDLTNDLTLNFNTDIDSYGISDDTYKTRPYNTSWDIGADEVITPIYRSVAPEADGNLAALASGDVGGDLNQLNISDSTATFNSALPSNVGVGDALEYDDDNDGDIDGSDSIAFITARTSSTVYTIKTSTGGVPTAPSAADEIHWNINRAYTSLANAEAGTENENIASGLRDFDAGNRDIKANSEQWNFACYANGTAADTADVTIGGWTTEIQNYIRVYTPYLTSEVGTSQRHQGKWDDGKYRLIVANLDHGSLTIRDKNVFVDGLQVSLVRSSGSNGMSAIYVYPYDSSEINIKISNNIVRGQISGGSDYSYGIQYETGTSITGTSYVWNNIIYDFDYNSGGGIIFRNDSAKIVYNNTIYNSIVGFNLYDGSSDVIVKNNIVKGSGDTNAYIGTFAAGTDYNATDGTDDIGIGSNNRVSQAFTFADATNKDFHLASTDAGAKDYGVDLSQDAIYQQLIYTNSGQINTNGQDIDGSSRPLPGSGLSWDIGADEVATPIYRSIAPSATGDLNTDSRTVTVLGHTAKFSGAMPDNVGVGDAIQYDSDGNSSIDAIAFITGRVSDTEYSVESGAGGSPPATLPAFPSNSVLDDFNRTGEGPPPSSSWTNALNGMKVVSNRATGGPTSPQNNSDYYNTATYTNSEVYTTLANGYDDFYLIARYSGSTNGSGYMFYLSTASGDYDNLVLYKFSDISNAGTYTMIGWIPRRFATGESYGMRLVGSTIKVYVKPAGGSWEQLGNDITDSTYASGYVGMGAWYNTDGFTPPELDDFGGGSITTTRTANVYRAHTSLANAEAGIENSGLSDTVQNFDDWTTGGAIDADDAGRNIWTNNEQWSIAAYANGTTADTTAVTIQDWTTSTTNYIKIYTPYLTTDIGKSQRHPGKWDNSKYRMETSDFGIFGGSMGEDVTTHLDLRLEGLQIKSNAESEISSGIIILTSSGDFRASENIVTGNPVYGIVAASNFGENRIWNNIVYLDQLPAGGLFGQFGIAFFFGGTTSYVYNNTSVNSFSGYMNMGGVGILKNNIAQNSLYGYGGEGLPFDASSTNNIVEVSNYDLDGFFGINAFGASADSGATSSAAANKLIDGDSGKTFTSTVKVGMIVANTTDETYSYVTAVDSDTQLSLNDDIMGDSEDYTIYTNRFGNVKFVDEAGKDFHLDPTDIAARNMGVNLDANVHEDNFNRDDANPIGGNWATVSGASDMQITGNTVAGTNGAGNNGAYWNANVFDNDQYSKVTIATLGYASGVMVRASANGNSYGFINNNGIYQMLRSDAGTPVQLGADYAPTPTAGDIIELRVIGNVLTPSVNGVDLPTRTDSTYASGSPGVAAALNTSRMDDWQGGNVVDPALTFSTDIDGKNRFNQSAWDIGADEAAKGIYYSVGQNVTDHGSGGNLTISGGIATFTVAQTAANLGAGDKVTYNTSSVAYLLRKVDTTHWYIVTATGAIPADDATPRTVDSITHTFDSLYDAENEADDASYMNATDLAANDFQLNIPCYNDAGAADSTEVVVSGYATSPANFIKIYTPVDTNTEANQRQRHWGKWDANKYRMDGGTAGTPFQPLEIQDEFVTVDGLQFGSNVEDRPADWYNDLITWYPTTNNGTLHFSNNIVRIYGTPDVNLTHATGIWSEQNNANATGIPKNYVWNNLFINEAVYSGTKIGYGIRQEHRVHDLYAYNNTYVGWGLGHYSGGSERVSYLRNNLFYNNTTATSGLTAANCDYNATDLSGLGYTAQTNDRVSRTFSFSNSANGDFHLAVADAGARNYGANLSANASYSFSTDIDGSGRSLWDIGADEGSVEMEATVMQTGGDYSSLSGWETGMGTDLVTPATMVFSGTRTNAIADNTALYLCRSSVYQNITADTVHSMASQILVENISNPSFVMAASDVWYTNNTCDSSNYFTISTAGGDPAIAVAKIDGAWTSADTSAVNVSGWETSLTNYIKIYTTTAARHPAKWDETKYRLAISTEDYVLFIKEAYTIIDGLQVKTSTGSYNYSYGIYLENNNPYYSVTGVTVKNNIVRKGYAGNSQYNVGIGANPDILNPNYFYNNIVYDFIGTYDRGISLNGDGGIRYTSLAYNNTAYNNTLGFGGESVTYKNNIAQGNTDGFNAWGSSHDYNVSDIAGDTTGYSASYREGQATDVTFVNENKDDFHLANDDLYAKNGGTDLGADTTLPVDVDIDGSTRTGTHDIGADEAATQIYYSVGQNTNNNETGAGNVDVDAATRTATFTVAQTATNMGVGDVIDYDTDNKICYITEKVSTTVWKCQSATGGAPTDSGGNVVVNSIHHSFQYLVNAENDSDDAGYLNTANLVTGNYVLNIPCYYDTGADQTAVTVIDWTTGPANYIKIYTPNDTSKEVNQTQRHSGKWNDGKYRIEASTVTTLYVLVPFARIDGLQIKNSYASGDGNGIYLNSGSYENVPADIYISNSILVGAGTSSDAGIYVYRVGDGVARIWNNILYDWGADASGGSIQDDDAGSTAYVYNNTVITSNSGFGIRDGVDNSIVAKNNIAKAGGSDYYGTFATGSDYNASADATAPGTNSRTSQTFTFLDETGDDFHLAFADTGAKGYGTNLKDDTYLAFQDDIDSQERTGNWSIGADEPRETEMQSATQKAESITDGLVLYQSFDGGHMDWSDTDAEARDQSGNNNNGDVVGATSAIGKRGQALNFDGDSNYVDLGNVASIDEATHATWSFWMKQPNLINGNYILNRWDGNYLGASWIINTTPAAFGVGNDEIEMIITNGGADFGYTDSNVFTANTWYYVTFVYDGTQSTNETKLKLYVNGAATELHFSGTIPTSLPAAARTVKLGAESYGGGTRYYFNGQIDEVRIYDRALSPAEIGDLYTLGQEKIGMSLTNKNTSGLVGMWSFDGVDMEWEDTDAEALDRSGNVNDGDVVGATPTIGKKGQALSFNGSSDYVSTPAISLVSAFSVSFWIKTNTLSVNATPFAWNWFNHCHINSSMGAEFTDKILCTDGTGNVGSTSEVNDNEWHHIVWTNTGSNQALYFDGQSQNTDSAGPIPADAGVTLMDDWGGGRSCGGVLDEVRIYDRALTPDEVGDLYRMGQVKIKR